MKTIISKLITLADSLDKLGLKKDADALDKIITKVAAGDDFGDYLNLFDSPVGFDTEEDSGPGGARVVLDEPEIHTPLDEEEAPLSQEKKEREVAPNRLQELMRRNEILKLKKKIEKIEQMEKALEDVAPADELKLPVATPEDLSFEDEEDDEENDENDADDDGLMDKLKDILKESPALAKKILKLVNDNPELLDLAL